MRPTHGRVGGRRRRRPCDVVLVVGLVAGLGLGVAGPPAPADAYGWSVGQEDGAPVDIALSSTIGWPETPLACDGDGDGLDAPAGFVAGRFRFLDAPGPVTFGDQRDTAPLCGDWDGDGDDTPAIVRNGMWLIRNEAGSGPPDLTFRFGGATVRQVPVAGDWDGDGVDGIGMVDGNRWSLRQTASSGSSDLVVTTPAYWCRSSDVGCRLLPADWNGDGRDEPGQIDRLGTVRPGDATVDPSQTWVVGRFSGGAQADLVRVRGGDGRSTFAWSRLTGPESPSVTGVGGGSAVGLFCDNDGDGLDEPAAAEGGVFTFSDGPRLWLPWADGPGYPLCGDWDGNRTQTPGFYDSRAGVFRLTNLRSNGAPQITMRFGGRGLQAVAGDWNGDGRDGVAVVHPSTGQWEMRDTLTSGAPQGHAQVGGAPLVGWDSRRHRSLPGGYASGVDYVLGPEYPDAYVQWVIVGGSKGVIDIGGPPAPDHVLMDRHGRLWMLFR